MAFSGAAQRTHPYLSMVINAFPKTMCIHLFESEFDFLSFLFFFTFLLFFISTIVQELCGGFIENCSRNLHLLKNRISTIEFINLYGNDTDMDPITINNYLCIDKFIKK